MRFSKIAIQKLIKEKVKTLNMKELTEKVTCGKNFKKYLLTILLKICNLHKL